MNDETEVRFIEPHPESGGRHQRLDPVGQQVGFELLAFGGVGGPGVGGDIVTQIPQQRGEVAGSRHRQRVDDPRTLKGVKLFGDPGDPLGGGRNPNHRQVQRLTVQAAAQHQGVRTADTQLRSDVLDDAVVGGRGGGQHRGAGSQFGDQGADAPVIRPEVVAPVRDAVRLVDDDEAGVGGQGRQNGVAKVRVVQPLRAHQQHVDLTGGDPTANVVPLGDIAGIDGCGPNPGALRGGNLVAHQGQQRRDDDGGAPALFPQQLGGDEVHRRLSPAGALHYQCPAALDHQRLDRGPLVIAQHRLGSGELFEDRLGAVAGGHRPIVHRVSDSAAGGGVNPGRPPARA